MSEPTIRILTNPEVIAVDQDPLGLQSILVAQPSPGLQVWAKPMAHPGEYAVVLLNRTAVPAPIGVSWSAIELEPSSPAIVRDLWAFKDLGTSRSSYSTTVPAGDVVMLTIQGVDEKATRYEAGSAANELSGGAAAAPCSSCSGRRSVAIGGRRPLTFKVAPMQGPAYVRISYINRGDSSLMARLTVNDQIATSISFPPTVGRNAVGTITIEAYFDRTRTNNLLTFLSPCDPGPSITSITVLGGRTALDPSTEGTQ